MTGGSASNADDGVWRIKVADATQPTPEEIEQEALRKLRLEHRKQCQQAFNGPKQHDDRPRERRPQPPREQRVAARRRAGAR